MADRWQRRSPRVNSLVVGGGGGGREASTKGVEVHAHLRKFEKSMF